MRIFKKINDSLASQMPFVAFKKPNSSELQAYFQNNNSLQQTIDFTEAGFVFSSFDGLQNIVFTIENSELIQEKFESKVSENSIVVKTSLNPSDTQKHIQLVNKAVAEIKNTSISKIVVSRKEIIETDLSILSFFDKLLHFNSDAFAYIWYHPKIGIWSGAFSEQLLKIKNYYLSTMSVAGTQIITEQQELLWQSKEIEEQQIVTSFIADTLKNELEYITISEPKTIIARHIAHLKTDISGQLKASYKLDNIIKSLHPTPAVCGFPKNEAMNFILQNENYNREFYAGFLGEMNVGRTNAETNLFVNLRCLKINTKSVEVFVGGGITKNSIPELEWEETVQKSQAIRALL